MRDVLKYLFPVPKEDSKRVMTFSNEDDFISFRSVNSTGIVWHEWLTVRRTGITFS